MEWDCPEGQARDVCAAKGGLKWIYIYGQIEGIDAMRIASFEGMLPPDAKFPPVYVNSEGGSIVPAQWIGRILRRRQASIEGKDVLSPDNDSTCASACVLIALGATTRQFRDIGVHLPAVHTTKHRGVIGVQAMSAEDMAIFNDYLTEMGAPERLKKLLEATPHSEMSFLTYNPRKPREDQEIVQLGFRMLPDDPSVEQHKSDTILTLADNERLLQQGARAKDIRAARILGEHYFYGTGGTRKNTSDGLKYLHLAADAGDRIADFMLGNIYYEGRQGVEIDQKKAHRHFLHAARAGDHAAQFALGRIYLNGDGIPASLADAVYWVTRAAEQGNPRAYFLLGSMRFNGRGFEPDEVEAYMWLKLAVKKLPAACTEREDSENLLKSFIQRMTEDQKREGDRRISAWKPLSQTSISSLCDD